MALNNSTSKGNGASKRMSNPKLKLKRANSWARGQKVKAARRERLAEQCAANVTRRAEGEPTPWEISKAKRAERRRPLQRAA